MCYTAKLPEIKRMRKLSQNFEIFFTFYLDTINKVKENNSPSLKKSKLQMKDFIFKEIKKFRENSQEWSNEAEGVKLN